jgi:hypothetical protein
MRASNARLPRIVAGAVVTAALVGLASLSPVILAGITLNATD